MAIDRSWTKFVAYANKLGKGAKKVLMDCGVDGNVCKDWGKGVYPDIAVQQKIVDYLNQDVADADKVSLSRTRLSHPPYHSSL